MEFIFSMWNVLAINLQKLPRIHLGNKLSQKMNHFNTYSFLLPFLKHFFIHGINKTYIMPIFISNLLHSLNKIKKKYIHGNCLLVPKYPKCRIANAQVPLHIIFQVALHHVTHHTMHSICTYKLQRLITWLQAKDSCIYRLMPANLMGALLLFRERCGERKDETDNTENSLMHGREKQKSSKSTVFSDRVEAL